MINGLKLSTAPCAGAWSAAAAARSAIFTALQRCADHTFTLQAGAFDIDAERGRQFGQRLGWIPTAVTPTIEACSAARLPGLTAFRRCQLPRQITPTSAICRAALEAGLHVVCEKPLCFSSEEADELVALSQRRRKIIGVTTARLATS